MKILCTGAAGFIGSHTADRLLADGHEVHGFDNMRTGKIQNLAKALEHPKFRFTNGDITHRFSIKALIRHFEPDVIIHLAAQVSINEGTNNPGTNVLINVMGTRIVAENAVHFKVPRIVFASSAAVYGNPKEIPIREASPRAPINLYGASKMDAETLLQKFSDKHGLAVVCLRYFNVYGPRQDPNSDYSGVITKFQQAAKAQEPATIYGDGSQTRDFIHVSDVAEANLISATMPMTPHFEAFNIGTGAETAIKDLWISCGCRTAMELPPRTGDVHRSVACTWASREVLGFTAKVKLADGLSIT